MKQITKYLRSTIAGPLIVLLIIIVIAALTTSRFLRPANLVNLALEVAIVAIVAIGGTLVILTGGIDLSPGSTVALVCVCLAYLVRNMGVSLPVGIVLMLFLGLFLGYIIGIFAGLWFQCLGWFASIVNMLFGFAIFLTAVVDLVLLLR